MPRMVVRMNPDGSFGPGMRNLAITPAMKPMIKIERAQTSAFMPGLSEPCSRCVQGADKASRHAAGNTAPALTNPNRGPGSNGYEHRTYCSARRQVEGALVYLHDPHRQRLPICRQGHQEALGAAYPMRREHSPATGSRLAGEGWAAGPPASRRGYGGRRARRGARPLGRSLGEGGGIS